MSGHVTRQSPSWRNWFLNKLGLTDLPTPINCWYCNHTSYLLPGSKQTENNWYCNLCENVNALDKYGDIMDAPPLPETTSSSAYGSAIEQRKKQPLPSTSIRPTSKATLCDNCQRNQNYIYQVMSDYIRDESDPDYEYYVQTADEYQQSLHAKHPLCNECQTKIQDMVAEQRMSLRRQRINQQRQLSLETKIPIRLTRFQYRVQALLWFLLHGSVLFLCGFAIQYPPEPLDYKQWAPSMQKWSTLFKSPFIFRMNSSQHTVISLSSPSSSSSSPPSLPSPLSIQFSDYFSFPSMLDVLSYTTQSVFKMTRFIYFAHCKLINTVTLYLTALKNNSASSSSSHDDMHHINDMEKTSWDVTDIGLFGYILFYIISFTFMHWHIQLSRSFLPSENISHWRAYKMLQRCLYVSRFGFLFSLALSNSPTRTTLWIIYVSIYTMILLWSVLYLILKTSSRQSKWPGRIVGKSNTTDMNNQQKTTESTVPMSRPSSQQAYSPLKPFSSASVAPSTPPKHYLKAMSPTSQQRQQQQQSIFHQPFASAKASWYTTPLQFFGQQQHRQPQSESNDEVDGLTAELGRISV